MRTARIALLLLALSQPALAHHTRDHMLFAPTPVPAPALAPVASPAPPESGGQFWFALGPFFALVLIGIVRWQRQRRRAAEPESRSE